MSLLIGTILLYGNDNMNYYIKEFITFNGTIRYKIVFPNTGLIRDKVFDTPQECLRRREEVINIKSAINKIESTIKSICPAYR